MQDDVTPVVFSPQDVARFWAKVDQSGGPEACWPWLASRNYKGYGWAYLASRKFSAHRAAYLIANGSIGAGRFVCHSCDHPECCNPAHLWAGTHTENQADSTAKGRHFQPDIAGEKHGSAKLTEDDIPAIRAALAQGDTRRGVARRYGVSRRAVQLIASGATWRHVPIGEVPQ